MIQNLIDRLPTEPGPVWLLLLVGAAVLTFGLVSLLVHAAEEWPGPIVFVVAVLVVLDAIANTVLLVRARDAFWSDSWVSVALVLGVVLLAGGLIAWLSLDDFDIDSIPMLLGAGASAVGIAGWTIDHMLDTADRALKSSYGIGLAGTVLLVGAAVAYFFFTPRRY